MPVDRRPDNREPILTVTHTMTKARDGLMAAAQDGHDGAYRRLLGEVQVWLDRYYARRLPPGLVDDAVQDTLIAIHEKRHTYDRARPFGPWLAAVARYKWIDRLCTMTRSRTDRIGNEEFAVKDHGARVLSATVLDQLLGELRPARATAIRLVKLDGFSIKKA